MCSQGAAFAHLAFRVVKKHNEFKKEIQYWGGKVLFF